MSYGTATAPRRGVVVLKKKGVLGARAPLPRRVHVGEPSQPRPEALVGEQVEDPVEQVLHDDVLLVILAPVLAMHRELELVLAGEQGVLDAVLGEVEPDRRKPPGLGGRPGKPPRARLGVPR